MDGQKQIIDIISGAEHSFISVYRHDINGKRHIAIFNGAVAIATPLTDDETRQLIAALQKVTDLPGADEKPQWMQTREEWEKNNTTNNKLPADYEFQKQQQWDRMQGTSTKGGGNYSKTPRFL